MLCPNWREFSKIFLEGWVQVRRQGITKKGWLWNVLGEDLPGEIGKDPFESLIWSWPCLGMRGENTEACPFSKGVVTRAGSTPPAWLAFLMYWRKLKDILLGMFHPWNCSRPGWMTLWFGERCSCMWEGEWNWMNYNVPSKPNYSMIPSFHDTWKQANNFFPSRKFYLILRLCSHVLETGISEHEAVLRSIKKK